MSPISGILTALVWDGSSPLSYDNRNSTLNFKGLELNGVRASLTLGSSLPTSTADRLYVLDHVNGATTYYWVVPLSGTLAQHVSAITVDGLGLGASFGLYAQP